MFNLSNALVEWAQPYADAAGLPYLPVHIPTILRSAIFWFSLQFLSSGLSPWLLPRTIKPLPVRSRLNWDFHVVSFVHSSIIAPLALYFWIYGVPGVDRVGGYDFAIGQLYAFSLGFFIWDIYVSARYEGLLFIMHGVLAATGMVFVFRPMLMTSGLSFVTWEASTPFLNIHWFLDKAGLTGSRYQMINAIFLVGTYVIVRLSLSLFQTYTIITSVWDPTYAFPTTQCIFFTIAPVVLVVLNYYWFSLMVKAILKRFRPKKE